MSSEKFEILEEDLVSLLADTKSLLHNKLPGASGEEQRRLVRSIQKNIDEANSMMTDMSREVSLAPSPYRLELSGRMKEHRKEIESAAHGLATVTSMMSAHPASSSQAAAHQSAEDSMRSQLYTGNQSLTRAGESIARSHQIAAETDTVGGAVIDELGTQREQLTRTRDRLHGTDENLTKSRKILRSMARKVVTNKFILIIIILVEAAILAGVVYYRFFSKK